jgi:hypothetical protein
MKIHIVMLRELVQFYSQISMPCVFEDEVLRQSQFNEQYQKNCCMSCKYRQRNEESKD